MAHLHLRRCRTILSTATATSNGSFTTGAAPADAFYRRPFATHKMCPCGDARSLRWARSLGGRCGNPFGGASRTSSVQSRSIVGSAPDGARPEGSNGPEDSVRDGTTFEELVQVASERLESSSSGEASRFWTRASKLLHDRGNVAVVERTGRHLAAILVHTLDNLRSFAPQELARAALGMAEIGQTVAAAGRAVPDDSPDNILHDLFLGEDADMSSKQFIFDCLAEASMHKLAEFDAADLSNLIYAYGVARYACAFDDASTLFDVLAPAAIAGMESMDDLLFDPPEIANIVWAYANAGVSNPDLFHAAGDIIVAHGSLESFTAHALANIVWSYAELGVKHPELFEKVADHIFTLDSLDGFDAQALSDLEWAYAQLDASHPALAQKVAEHRDKMSPTPS